MGKADSEVVAYVESNEREVPRIPLLLLIAIGTAALGACNTARNQGLGGASGLGSFAGSNGAAGTTGATACGVTGPDRSPAAAATVFDFDVAKQYPTRAGYVFSVRAGDLDGDGRADLVVPRLTTDPGLQIFFASPGGGYPQAAPEIGGLGPIDAAVGDVNGDGKADVVLTGADPRVLYGDGKGGLPTGVLLDGSVTFSPLIADIDGDGKLDIVGADSSVSIFKGNGDGTFQRAQSMDVGMSPSQVAIADVNGDGKLDLVAFNGHRRDQTPVVSFRLGMGGGAFGPLVATTIAAQGGVEVGVSRELSTADFNGDGAADLAVVDTKGVSILAGQTNGTLTATQRFAASFASDSAAAATGDFNRDGHADLAVVSSADSLLTVLLGDGRGGFGPPTRYGTGGFTSEIAVADANGDGISDLLLSDGNIIVILGRGDGTFHAAPILALPGGAPPSAAAAGDIDGDGRKDVVVAGFASGSVATFLNTGGPQTGFRAGPSVDLGVRYSVSLACMDADGALDLVFDSSNTRIGVAPGDGRGGFRPPALTAGGEGRLVVADFDGDGDRDVAAATGGNIRLFLNDGTGALVARPPYAAAATGGGARLAAADLDGDGKLDLAASLFSVPGQDGSIGFSTEVLVLLGGGDGSLRFGTRTDLQSPVADLATGDFNGDGHADLLAVLLEPAADLALLPGDGRAAFSAPIPLGMGPGGQVIATDFDGDGKLDILFTATNGVRAALGRGDGSFAPAIFFAAVAQHSPVAVDVTDDGRPDVLLLSPSGYATVFANASR